MTAVPLAAGPRPDPGLPAPRRGGQPQRVLATLLGDYWHGRTESLPTTALVELASPFGISPAGARIALRRLAERGWLHAEQGGRGVRYRLNPGRQELFDAGVRRLMRFGRRTEPWDGRWTVVTFTHPEAERQVREVLRTRLRWLGFSDLYGSVWVSPWDRTAEAAAVLDKVGVTTATVMTATVAPGSPAGGDPARAWDLPRLRADYEEFLAAFRPVAATAVEETRTGVDALLLRTRLTDWWRRFPGVDPELPAELLPAGWPRAEAAGVFARVYEALADRAVAHVDAVLSAHDPALAGMAAAHSIAVNQAG